MRICLDLCSGLGGFSQAFVDAGWDVVRIDNDPRFQTVPFTHIEDVCDIDAVMCTVRNVVPTCRSPSVILASPPCERFSLGNRMFPKKGIKKALEIVGACLEIIAEYRPKSWVLENPKGRLRWFLGNSTMTIDLSNYGRDQLKPTDLWGNIALPMIPAVKSHIPFHRSLAGKLGPNNPLRSALRAEIPYDLSKAIMEAV